MKDDEAALYDLATALYRDKKVSDPVYKAALEKFGERGIMDIIGIIGYYDLVSMTLITMQAGPPNDSVPAAAGAGEVGVRNGAEHDPEKWVPVFPRDKREAFARRSCSNKKIERDNESKKSHHALGRRMSRRFEPARSSGSRALSNRAIVCFNSSRAALS